MELSTRSTSIVIKGLRCLRIRAAVGQDPGDVEELECQQLTEQLAHSMDLPATWSLGTWVEMCGWVSISLPIISLVSFLKATVGRGCGGSVHGQSLQFVEGLLIS
jgi:hypothetical protein